MYNCKKLENPSLFLVFLGRRKEQAHTPLELVAQKDSGVIWSHLNDI
jgi:hypothetical protein